MSETVYETKIFSTLEEVATIDEWLYPKENQSQPLIIGYVSVGGHIVVTKSYLQHR